MPLHLSADETTLEAATLAFAMLRFAEGAAHPLLAAGSSRLGRDFYVFSPATRQVPREEVPAFLASLTSPALLYPTTTRGLVALLLLNELSGERATAAQHTLANQQAILKMVEEQGLVTPGDRILLEFGNDELIITLEGLRAWTERFSIGISWNIAPLAGDPRAAARICLSQADGVTAPPSPPGRLRIAGDIPLAHYTDAEMVLAALRRHLPEVMHERMDTEKVYVWLILNADGEVERTAVSTLAPTGGPTSIFEVALLEPFSGEALQGFQLAGSIQVPREYAANVVGVKWLQRRADVVPEPENGRYQFDAGRLVPPVSALQPIVEALYPRYVQVGLTEWHGGQISADGKMPEVDPSEAIMPWLIADEDGRVLESELGPVLPALQTTFHARKWIETRHPDFRFKSIRVGGIRKAGGGQAPVVWATLEPSS